MFFLCWLRSVYSCVACLLCWVYLFFGTKPRVWLGRMSSKWPILCHVGRKTLAWVWVLGLLVSG